jgi:hypothetical protein
VEVHEEDRYSRRRWHPSGLIGCSRSESSPTHP